MRTDSADEKASRLQQRTPCGYRWTLPPRETSELTMPGWILVGTALMGFVFFLAWISVPVSMLNGNGFGLVFVSGIVLIGIWGLSHILRVLAAGIAVLRNQTHSVIEIDDRYLTVIEHFGWFRSRRRVRIVELQSLKIRQLGDGIRPADLRGNCVVAALTQLGGFDMLMAIG